MPQIKRAYQFNASHLERYLVACYEAKDSASFPPDCDNARPGAAHRQFAATVNLNSEEYEGGELCFPEFGKKKFRPPSGSALVFSCSLLHQVLPVQCGTRYAFLPLIGDEAAEQGRKTNSAPIGAWYEANLD
jgi:predicted 2-oxoglutarate/Fe(II)-dependent dioxygenase YbiX